MSSCYYLVYMDELSNNKQLSNLGACVMSTYIDNTSISDDPALVANVPPNMYTFAPGTSMSIPTHQPDWFIEESKQISNWYNERGRLYRFNIKLQLII